MEARVVKLEATLQQLQTDVAVIKANHATREDVSKVSSDLLKIVNEQTWKLITWTTGFGVALVGATFWIARTIH